jgi:hypothetical protein
MPNPFDPCPTACRQETPHADPPLDDAARLSRLLRRGNRLLALFLLVYLNVTPYHEVR